MSDPTLVPMSEAAAMSERSVATIRRWIKAGKLTRHQEAAPARGGSARVLVDSTELMKLLANTGQAPADHTLTVKPDTPHKGDTTRPDTGDHARVATPGAIQIMRLEHQLELQNMRTEIIKANNERAVQAIQVDALKETITRLERQHSTTLTQLSATLIEKKNEINDWTDRYFAIKAELDALRKLTSAPQVPWYRRLLGAPVAVIEES